MSVDIKLFCPNCHKRYLASPADYGVPATCDQCGKPIDVFSFTTPERTRSVPQSVEQGDESLRLDGLLHPLRRVGPGRFRRAGESETSSAEVSITQQFWMGETPVTQVEFRHLMGWSPSGFEGVLNPVEGLTWFEAAEFCERLTERCRRSGFLGEDLAVRLPYEAEWEFACRTDGNAPAKQIATTTRFCFGDDTTELGDYAWYERNSGEQTHPVAEKYPSPRGFYDLHGNVAEWCGDWFAPIEDAAAVDPTGPKDGDHKVCRGGGWGAAATRCRGTDRVAVAPSCRSALLGFRVVLAKA